MQVWTSSSGCATSTGGTSTSRNITRQRLASSSAFVRRRGSGSAGSRKRIARSSCSATISMPMRTNSARWRTCATRGSRVPAPTRSRRSRSGRGVCPRRCGCTTTTIARRASRCSLMKMPRATTGQRTGSIIAGASTTRRPTRARAWHDCVMRNTWRSRLPSRVPATRSGSKRAKSCAWTRIPPTRNTGFSSHRSNRAVGAASRTG
ncbi:hypothetical protein LMG22037_06684 [Paraburkholderia phenoliruptrix]|uniref:Uncharacterized protein n=1 Tax=Paraburkholderia phenoliruptrix TaxID=252970 RepID=A0A6J5CVM0_9BURK|nr:hypothetical protein LMG22037_06684 [Paraburkholderia phenoliruptrix]